MMNVHSSVFVFLFGALIFSSVFLADTKKPNFVIILDSSQHISESKGSLIKEAVRCGARTARPDNSVSVYSYGYKSKLGCDETERIASPEQDDYQLTRSLFSLRAQGRASILHAIRTVLDDTKSKGETAGIVLIAAGVEQCTFNPCGQLRAFISVGLKFQLAVIGIGVNQKAQKQLRCLAMAGNGKYYEANTVGEVKTAISTAARENAAKPISKESNQ